MIFSSLLHFAMLQCQIANAVYVTILSSFLSSSWNVLSDIILVWYVYLSVCHTHVMHSTLAVNQNAMLFDWQRQLCVF